MSNHILVVDDEPRLLRLLRSELESSGYKVTTATDGQSAITTATTTKPDLVILDIMLPRLDGFAVCRQLREFMDAPIIMLTARGDEAEKVKGLNLGADDYLTKPFGMDELLARVRAVLRRTRAVEEPKPPPPFTSESIAVDFARRRVSVRGREVKLSPTEYKLFYQLVINPRRVMLHEDLLERVWGPEYRDNVEYLWVYIGYLRQKIEPDPRRPQFILSEPGVGYVFEPNPAPSSTS